MGLESFPTTNNQNQNAPSLEKASRAAGEYAIKKDALMREIDAHIIFETSLDGRAGGSFTASQMRDIVENVLVSEDRINTLYLFPEIRSKVMELQHLRKVITGNGGVIADKDPNEFFDQERNLAA